MELINKIAYLPIEFKIREFYSKALLCSHLVSNGYQVIIGQQWELYNQINHLPKGIFLFKSHNKIHHPAMDLAKKRGHITIALEEESLALTTNKSFARNSPKELNQFIDFILTSGKREKDFQDTVHHNNFITHVTGNPRADVIKSKYIGLYTDEVNFIKSKFGDYYLINTNFAMTNSLMGDINQVAKIARASGALKLEDEDSINEFNEYFKWEIENRKGIYDIIMKLSNISNKKIIIRPHPAENIEFIKEQYKGIDRIYVIREGSHIPWTIACKKLIHTSCTTGLEAALMGKEAFSYVPYDIWYSEILSNKVNKVFRTADEIVNAILNAEDTNIQAKFKIDIEEYLDNANKNSSILKIISLFNSFSFSEEKYNCTFTTNITRQPFQINKCQISYNEIKNILYKISNIDHLNFEDENVAINEVADSLFLIKKLD